MWATAKKEQLRIEGKQQHNYILANSVMSTPHFLVVVTALGLGAFILVFRKFIQNCFRRKESGYPQLAFKHFKGGKSILI